MLVTTPKILAAHLRDVRKTNKISQKNAASLVGLRQATISTFESKPDKTTIETLFKILASMELELHVVQKGLHLNNRNN